ncbi:MAG: [protein-PII] uridylyltransferase [Alphaproteobacteria bacterium]|nr:[protein-PII] uridylyltransferase [Alphaproteobacteria bacterium]
MHSIPRQREIIDRRALVVELDRIMAEGDKSAEAVRGQVLALFKRALEDGRAQIRRRFDAGAEGLDIARTNAFLIDQILRLIHDFAFEHVYPLSNPTAGERLALIAVGGYGRGEMAPFSDVDLLFLNSYKATPHTEQIVEYALYMLWDLGLKVGHATRSVDDCIRLAKSDLTIRTSLLESRYLCGDNHLYAELRRRFLNEVATGTGPDFVESKLAERDVRHERMGDSRYVLEPNIKEGKGGLRDLHTLFWIGKYLYRVDEVPNLVGQGMLMKSEAARFAKAEAFLWTVRCHLHYLADRAEERLTFDMQPRLAAALGYADREGTLGVERFMKRYFLVAKDVGDLTRIFCAALEAQHQRRPRFSLKGLLGRKREVEGFRVEGGWLTAESGETFTKVPVNLLRIFHAAQEHELDVHPSALRLITRSLDLIDGKLRRSKEGNRLFLEMLTSPKDPEKTLRRLNEAGVFGRFVPDFGRVVAQMQYDMYHVYTVDEHTIRAIGLLHGIESGKYKDVHPLSTEIFPKIQSRRALYLALLLHDIAKGRGGRHSELGAEVANKLGPRLGLSAEETETVAWLVLHHLAMSNTAQKRDIDDPKTIADFAELVQSPERLRLLLVLTVADMRATGPKVWNGWKAALLRELYYRAEEVMSGSFQQGEGVKARVEAAKDALRRRLSDWDSSDVEAFLARGYTSYWLTLDTDTQARHAALVREADTADQPLAIDRRVDSFRAVTEVTVYTQDQAGLFSKIAGAMALSGATIVDAKIFTLTNGMALDSFCIQDSEGGAFERPDQLAKLSARIELALSGRLRLQDELASRRSSLPARARRVFKAPPRVMIDNAASRWFTVVELNGRDRPGLLYDVTRALNECGLRIASAKISTFGERVVDVFYVKDIFGMKVDHEGKIAQIRERVLEALVEPEAAATPQPAETTETASDRLARAGKTDTGAFAPPAE